MTITTYTFEATGSGWTGKINNLSTLTQQITAGTICSQLGYWKAGPTLFGGLYYDEAVIQTDSTIDADSITVHFSASNGNYALGTNQVTIKWSDSNLGPWTGGSSHTFGSVTNFSSDGCQSVTITGATGLSGKYFRIYVNTVGNSASVATELYKVEVSAGPAVLKFYTGTGTLTERSDLTISAIQRGGMLVRPDGLVVVGSAAAADSVVVEKAGVLDDYATWTDITGGHPQGRVTSLQEV